MITAKNLGAPIELKRRYWKPSASDVEKVIQLRKARWFWQDIGGYFGVEGQVVYKRAKRCGWIETGRMRWTPTDDQRLMIPRWRSMYPPMSWRWIGRMVQAHPDTIQRWWRENHENDESIS